MSNETPSASHPTMLTYGDFYDQLKCTGFGDVPLAAHFLVKRCGFSFSNEDFSRFVTVVKNVREEIYQQNPNNKLASREFEHRYERWLKTVRFTIDTLANVAVEGDCVSIKNEAPTDVQEAKWRVEEELSRENEMERERMMREKELKIREKEVKEKEQEVRRKEREGKKRERERELRLALEKELKRQERERTKVGKKEEMEEKKKRKKEELEREKALRRAQKRMEKDRRLEATRKAREKNLEERRLQRMYKELREIESKDVRRQARQTKKREAEMLRQERFEKRMRKEEMERAKILEREMKKELRRREAKEKQEREKRERIRRTRHSAKDLNTEMVEIEDDADAAVVLLESKEDSKRDSVGSESEKIAVDANDAEPLMMTVDDVEASKDDREDDEDEDEDDEDDIVLPCDVDGDSLHDNSLLDNDSLFAAVENDGIDSEMLVEIEPLYWDDIKAEFRQDESRQGAREEATEPSCELSSRNEGEEASEKYLKEETPDRRIGEPPCSAEGETFEFEGESASDIPPKEVSFEASPSRGDLRRDQADGRTKALGDVDSSAWNGVVGLCTSGGPKDKISPPLLLPPKQCERGIDGGSSSKDASILNREAGFSGNELLDCSSSVASKGDDAVIHESAWKENDPSRMVAASNRDRAARDGSAWKEDPTIKPDAVARDGSVLEDLAFGQHAAACDCVAIGDSADKEEIAFEKHDSREDPVTGEDAASDKDAGSLPDTGYGSILKDLASDCVAVDDDACQEEIAFEKRADSREVAVTENDAASDENAGSLRDNGCDSTLKDLSFERDGMVSDCEAIDDSTRIKEIVFEKQADSREDAVTVEEAASDENAGSLRDTVSHRDAASKRDAPAGEYAASGKDSKSSARVKEEITDGADQSNIPNESFQRNGRDVVVGEHEILDCMCVSGDGQDADDDDGDDCDDDSDGNDDESRLSNGVEERDRKSDDEFTPHESSDEDFCPDIRTPLSLFVRRRTRGYNKKLSDVMQKEIVDDDHLLAIASPEHSADDEQALGQQEQQQQQQQPRPRKRGRQRESFDLKPHIKVDEEGKFRCPEEGCETKYAQIQSLTTHMQNRHGRFFFECERCEEKFSKRYLLSYHLEAAHNDGSGSFECDICHLRFTTFENRSRHGVIDHTDGEYPCGYCEKSFHDRKSETKHVVDNHAEEVVCCKECFGYFRCESTGLKHFQSLHPDRVLRCERCGKEFALRKSLTYHIESMHAMAVDWEASFVCDVVTCQRKFSTLENFTKHAPKHARERLRTKYGRVVCNICGQLRSEYHMRAHMKTHGPKGEADPNLSDELRGTCGVCGKQFVQLAKHVKRCHDRRTLKCPHCSKMYVTAYTLMNHVKTVHENQRYKCPLCDKSYAYSLDLNGHIHAVHNGRSWCCQFCGKNFLRSSERNRHEKSVHGCKAADGAAARDRTDESEIKDAAPADPESVSMAELKSKKSPESEGEDEEEDDEDGH